ncbi:MAG: hypothetical protein LBF44_00585 [Holosporaceae bacterium]|jgi:hypothetical protein|nr:hypothetical protein [Holosporaceae bacterium]
MKEKLKTLGADFEAINLSPYNLYYLEAAENALDRYIEELFEQNSSTTTHKQKKIAKPGRRIMPEWEPEISAQKFSMIVCKDWQKTLNAP